MYLGFLSSEMVESLRRYYPEQYRSYMTQQSAIQANWLMSPFALWYDMWLLPWRVWMSAVTPPGEHFR